MGEDAFNKPLGGKPHSLLGIKHGNGSAIKLGEKKGGGAFIAQPMRYRQILSFLPFLWYCSPAIVFVPLV